jgi:hypothetical protein
MLCKYVSGRINEAKNLMNSIRKFLVIHFETSYFTWMNGLKVLNKTAFGPLLVG